LPGCLFPTVTSIPKTCSPFPFCLTDIIPHSVQNELSWNCGTTPLLECILPDPKATCNQWPLCLTTVVGPTFVGDILSPTASSLSTVQLSHRQSRPIRQASV
jgi:hypothetical protein